MNSRHWVASRRSFLSRIAWGAAAVAAAPTFAEQLLRTPAQMEGPFYPDKLPLDTDNDLIIVNDALTPGVGEITHFTGRVLDSRGQPVRNALVEIWQCDSSGAYLHSGTDNAEKRDRNFQGFGRFLTSRDGDYYFRTIKPVAYPGRTPHIHMKVKIKGKEALTTQCYIKGHAQNQRDGVFMGIKDERARDSLAVDFAPIKESRAGELAAHFQIVLGFTPEA